MTKTTNIVLVGIGGQGTLTLMEMLALAAEEAGEEVRVLSRVSLARLGGSGMCHIRIGPAASAAIPMGEADILLALEMSEVLRALPMARWGGLAFVNAYRRLPVATGVAGIHYPTRSEVEEALAEHGLSCSAFSVATRSFSPALRLSNPSPSAYRASPCRIFTRLQWGGALEKQPGTALDTLYGLEYYTFRRIDRRSVRRIGVSFNGRTADSGSANWGSNPCTPARRGY